MSVRMATINKLRDNKYWHGSGEKGTFVYCVGAATMKNSMAGPQKINYNPTIPLLGIHIQRK